MTIPVQTQSETIKASLATFIEAYFDGNTHKVSGQDYAFPACYVRFYVDSTPQDANDTLDKPLITVVPAPGSDEDGQWVTGNTGDVAPVILTWAKHATATGYVIYRALQSGGGYTAIAGPLTGTSYVDSPAAGDYRYRVYAVVGGAEILYGGTVLKSVIAATPSNRVRRHNMNFAVFVTVPEILGGQRIADKVCSLLTSVICGSQGVSLRQTGLRFPQMTTPVGIRNQYGLSVNEMFARFQVDLEYS
jgi:hypothetical protein